MNVWRLQTNTDSKTGSKIADLCLNNNMIAMGWSLKDGHLPANHSQLINERRNIVTFDDYIKFIEQHEIYGGKIGGSVRRMHEISNNDLVWMRYNGIYYLGKFTESSQWLYNADQPFLDQDASNQVNNVEWHRAGDENDVPGAIATALIRGCTFCRINKEGVLEFSQLKYNELTHSNTYDVKMNKSPGVFYSLLSTDDCEDLLCNWLYHEYNYQVMPSTNKKSTELYECVLKCPKSGKSIYIQVKAGNKDICYEDYLELEGDIYLFTTKGIIKDKYGKKASSLPQNIHAVSPDKLYNFAFDTKSKNYLSNSISKWVDYLNTH